MADTDRQLPQNAKRVYSGHIFSVWEWEQKQYDGTTATYECVTRPDYASILATVGNQLIILREEQPHWQVSRLSLPGGRTDKSDDVLSEAKRELLEETGYSSKDWQKWKQVDLAYPAIYTAHFFIARNCEPVQALQLDPGEKITMQLMEFEDFLALPENPEFRGAEVIKELLLLRLYPEKIEEFRRLLFTSR